MELPNFSDFRVIEKEPDNKPLLNLKVYKLPFPGKLGPLNYIVGGFATYAYYLTHEPDFIKYALSMMNTPPNESDSEIINSVLDFEHSGVQTLGDVSQIIEDEGEGWERLKESSEYGALTALTNMAEAISEETHVGVSDLLGSIRALTILDIDPNSPIKTSALQLGQPTGSVPRVMAPVFIRLLRSLTGLDMKAYYILLLKPALMALYTPVRSQDWIYDMVTNTQAEKKLAEIFSKSIEPTDYSDLSDGSFENLISVLAKSRAFFTVVVYMIGRVNTTGDKILMSCLLFCAMNTMRFYGIGAIALAVKTQVEQKRPLKFVIDNFHDQALSQELRSIARFFDEYYNMIKVNPQYLSSLYVRLSQEEVLWDLSPARAGVFSVICMVLCGGPPKDHTKTSHWQISLGKMNIGDHVYTIAKTLYLATFPEGSKPPPLNEDEEIMDRYIKKAKELVKDVEQYLSDKKGDRKIGMTEKSFLVLTRGTNGNEGSIVSQGESEGGSDNDDFTL